MYQFYILHVKFSLTKFGIRTPLPTVEKNELTWESERHYSLPYSRLHSWKSYYKSIKLRSMNTLEILST